MKWKNLTMPKQVMPDPDNNDGYGKFVIEPLERGFGLTLGNALRRVLLSSLQGAAITAVRIDGVLHEFSTLPGVIEDVTEIILNLKQVRRKLPGDRPKTGAVELWTDRSILPQDAIAVAAKILRDHFSMFIHFEEPIEEEVEEEVDEEVMRVRKLLDKSVDELELSVRSSNCLRAAEIKTIGDLVQKSEPEMLKYRNFGRKSLKETQDILGEMGLHC